MSAGPAAEIENGRSWRHLRQFRNKFDLRPSARPSGFVKHKGRHQGPKCVVVMPVGHQLPPRESRKDSKLMNASALPLALYVIIDVVAKGD
jgi:hypothetical protein